MDGRKELSDNARWLLPGALTAAALASLCYRSWEPLFFSRYSAAFIVLLGSLCGTAAHAWWVCIQDSRWQLLAARIKHGTAGRILAIAFGTLFLMDLSTDLVETGLYFAYRSLIPLGLFGLAALNVSLVLLSRDDDRRVLGRIAFSLALSCVCA